MRKQNDKTKALADIGFVQLHRMQGDAAVDIQRCEMDILQWAFATTSRIVVKNGVPSATASDLDQLQKAQARLDDANYRLGQIEQAIADRAQALMCATCKKNLGIRGTVVRMNVDTGLYYCSQACWHGREGSEK